MIRFTAIISLLSACSFGMQSVDPRWSKSDEPQCSDSTITLDRVMGAAFLIAGSSTAMANQNEVGAGVSGVAVAVGLVYLLSASVGSKTFTDCQAARRQWAFSNAINARTPTTAASGPRGVTPAGAASMPRTSSPVTAPGLPPSPRDASRPQQPDANRPWAVGVPDNRQAAALALYNAGNQEFVQGQFSQALTRYKQAILQWDHPAIRYNMAVCLIHLDQPVEARDNLERGLAYGAAALGPDSYAQGMAYRKLLDEKLVRLTLDCPEPDEEVMLDGVVVFKGPGVVDRSLLPGEHQVVATKPGYLPASKKIILVAGKPATYEIRPIIDPRPRR
jgi:hypothetical protein